MSVIDHPTSPDHPPHDSAMLRIIGAFKLLKAAGLLFTAAVVGRLLHADAAETVRQWAERLQADPHAYYLRLLLEKISGLGHRSIVLAEIGLLFYAALFGVEGTGLLLRKRWAEYLTVIATATLIPLEGYEIYRRVSWVRILVLVVNVAIVIYLIWDIRRHAHRHAGTTGTLPKPDAAAI
jgi:uncharacterized membrane protein (DUF2068 family)